MNKQEKSKKESAAGIGVNQKKTNPYIALTTMVTIVAIIIAVTSVFAFNSYNKNKELESEVKAKEEELERQKKLFADLEAHTNGVETENDALTAQLEDLLDIKDKEPVITSAQLEEQLSALSELVTQKYIYTNADSATEGKEWMFGWDMPFSEKSYIVKYDGVIKAGINLKDIDIDVDEDNHIVTVTLPSSEITDNYVLHETVDTFGIKDGLFNEVTPNDSNGLISKGKEEMRAKAIERGLLTEADKEAEATIRAFLSLIPGMGTTYKLEVNHK